MALSKMLLKNQDHCFISNIPWFKAMMENPFEGFIIIDERGAIIYINSFYLNLLNLTQNRVMGRKIWEIIPKSKLYDTVIQGYSHWGEKMNINGRQVFVARFPIKREGRIIGAVSKTLFPDMTTAREVAEKINHPVINRDCCYGARHTCMDIIGESPSMLLVKKMARKASRTSSALLITGESGTGKGIFAEAIHNRSIRRDNPFIRVNCAAIPENLIESELFGYVDGAFTGASKAGKPGKFELAEGGTIFLDEIGDMPLFMQAKLLHVLQEKEVERIGGTKTIPLNVRVIAATNKNLKKLIQEGKFREDLYYRIKVLEIYIPPLRERLEDIPLLIKGLIKKINCRIGSDVNGVTPESLDILMQHDWPGNTRELENFLEQAIHWSEDFIIDVTRVPSKPWKKNIISEKIETCENESYHEKIDEKERKIIIEALTESEGNKSQAARSLNMQRSVLYKKIKRLNIDVSKIKY